MVELSRAAKAFKSFTGHDATRGYQTRLDDKPVKGYRMGEVVGIAYRATRDGQSDQYFHRFRKDARPDLVSKDDGRQLYITGGKYQVTERGIEDKKRMPALYVVNPSRRRRRRRHKAASSRRRVSIFTTNPRRRAAPKRRRRSVSRYRRNPVVVARANPMRRRRRSMSRFRRNPSVLGGGKGKINIFGMLMPGVLAGGGAVVSELAMAYLPIPANFKAGQLRHVTKAGVGLALGALSARFLSRNVGEAIAMGAIVVATHDLIKDGVNKAAPGVRFSGYGEYMGEYMGEYATPGGLGMYSAGATLPPQAFHGGGDESMSYTGSIHAGD